MAGIRNARGQSWTGECPMDAAPELCCDLKSPLSDDKISALTWDFL